MPAVHPQDFSAMTVLQPQKVIHDSSYLWPMRSENKFLRILSLGPPTRSQPFAEAVWRYSPGYSPFGSWRGLRRGLFLIQQWSAYLLTWILLGGTPPRPAAPGRAPPPLETSFTQSVPSPR